MGSKKNLEEKDNKGSNVGRWQAIPTWQIAVLLIIFFPVGIYLLWRQDRWTKRTKKITTWATLTAIVALFALMIIFAPPTVTVTSSLASMRADSYSLTGNIYPSNSKVTVNGMEAKVHEDTFTAMVPLKEGDNTLKVVIISGSKRTEQEFKIHRFTKSEIVAQEKAAAEKRSAQAAAKAKAEAKTRAVAAKKKAETDAAQAKAEANAAAKAAKSKAAAEAAAKAKAEAAALAAVTVSQKNAFSKAKSYLSYTAFSYQGLINQLEYEQFSTADATYGADHVGANWNEQAAKKAKSYMSYSSFSRGSLIGQLEYEKFTPEQAAFGASAVGL